MQQTEQIQAKRTPELAKLCHLAKNLYNEDIDFIIFDNLT